MTYTTNWGVDNGALSIGGQIVTTWLAPDTATKEENQSNIKLAAAAPDLLDALIELDQHIQSSGIEYPVGTFEVVQAAIAKARGQS